jgi:CubicO group peptidase (beta-lactamase class C family)
MTFSSSLLIGFALIFCSVATSHVIREGSQCATERASISSFDRTVVAGVVSDRPEEGKTVFKGSYGLANLETRTPISPFTNFRLASFTKEFTSMCIMFLVHDGKPSYVETLTKIFLDFPAYGSAITVRMMLGTPPDARITKTLTQRSFPARTT